MVDFATAFRGRNAFEVCEYIAKLCDQYIEATGTSALEYGSALHSALPNILTTIFGAPNTRGWMQTEMSPEQDAVIRRTLCVDGSLFRALLKLSSFPTYTYEMVTESFPEDVRKALGAGATQYLPRLYSGCVFVDERSTTNSTDLRMSSTKQSTIFPRPLAGGYKIKFKPIQFYLYYLLSVVTWKPQTTLTTGTTITTTTSIATFPSSTQARPNPYTIAQSNRPTIPNTVASTTQPYAPRTRSLASSVYNQIIEEYMLRLIPSVRNSQTFIPFVGSFFLDACMELWIRTTWIPYGQKLSIEHIHFIGVFVKYIVSGDLRRCMIGVPRNDDPATAEYKSIYNLMKEELYMLISRLALNWSKQDDFLQVIKLWSIWAAPWRQGANTNGLENNVYNPIADGWNYFVLDNALYYIPLVEIFLQRTATFNFAENPPPSGMPLATSNTLQHRSGQLLHTTSSNKPAADTHGQLQILYQLFNVLKTDCITQFLAELEECLSGLRSKAEGGAALMKNEKTCQQAIESFSTKYFYDHREAIGPKLEKIYDQLIQLGGGSWNPPHLYTAKLSPRADPLIKTLEALQQASQSKHDLTRGWGPGVHASSKSREHIKEIQRATELLKTIFSITVTPKQNVTASRSIFSALQKPKSRSVSDKKDAGIREAGLQKGGFLTPEEKLLVRQGKMICSHRNIPALGPRAEEVVWSYEVMFMVKWIVPFDRWMNRHYRRWVPVGTPYLPERLSVRFLAARINLLYIFLFICIIYIFNL